MKTCFKCHTTKSLTEFYKHSEMADGHLNKCKECTKKDVSDRYYSPEAHSKIVAYERSRFKDPHRKALINEYQRRRRSRNRKDITRSRTQRAVKRGTITKLPCEVCGNTKSEAHHTDYNDAFSVRWLCFKHHRELHGQIVNQ